MEAIATILAACPCAVKGRLFENAALVAGPRSLSRIYLNGNWHPCWGQMLGVAHYTYERQTKPDFMFPRTICTHARLGGALCPFAVARYYRAEGAFGDLRAPDRDYYIVGLLALWQANVTVLVSCLRLGLCLAPSSMRH